MNIQKEELWTIPEWQESFFRLICKILHKNGIEPIGKGFASMRIMAWSFVGRIETSHGVFYAKSVSSTTEYEPIVTKLLWLVSPYVVEVVDISETNGWILTKAMHSDDENMPFSVVVNAIEKYAELQVQSLEVSREICNTGIPVVELGKVQERLNDVLERFSRLDQTHPSHFTMEDVNLARSVENFFVDTERLLMTTGIPSTIEHGDLLAKNLLHGSDYKTLKWFDFGDASWNFPFISLDMMTEPVVSGYNECQIAQIKKAYLSIWSKQTALSMEKLYRVFDAAMIQATLRRAETRLDIMETVPVEFLGEMAPVAKDDFTRMVNGLVKRKEYD